MVQLVHPLSFYCQKCKVFKFESIPKSTDIRLIVQYNVQEYLGYLFDNYIRYKRVCLGHLFVNNRI